MYELFLYTSGHSVKHMVAALGAYIVYLQYKRNFKSSRMMGLDPQCARSVASKQQSSSNDYCEVCVKLAQGKPMDSRRLGGALWI